MKRIVALVLSLILVFAVTASVAALESEIPKQYVEIVVDSEGSGSADTSDVKVEKDSDDIVTLTANPDKGFFTHWIIDGQYEILDGKTIYDDSIRIRVISDIHATASFREDEEYLTMTVEAVTDAHGTAAVDKEKVLYVPGDYSEAVTFTATENDDEFVKWELQCDYAEKGSIDLTAKTITVHPSTDIHAIAYFKSAGAVPTENPDESGTSPKTGDALPYVIGFMAIALAGAIFAGKKLKKAN